MAKFPIFRVFYSATFTVLFIVLVCLLLIPPGDVIRKAQVQTRWYDVFSIAGVYLLTLVVIALFYASRLYTNRAALAAVPKAWIPIAETDLRQKVWRMISRGLARSASLAGATRPRDLSRELLLLARDGDGVDGVDGRRRATAAAGDIAEKNAPGAAERNKSPPRPEIRSDVIDPLAAARNWGHISHPGWSSPSTPDFPNLHYDAVVSELPHLLEAKAVALAQSDARSAAAGARETSSQQPSGDRTPSGDAGTRTDAQILGLLQRPASSGMREYVMHLARIGVIKCPAAVVTSFLAQYDRARFSEQGLTEEGFRNLMALFSDIVRGMTDLDGLILVRGASNDGDDDDGGSSSWSSRHSPASRSRRRRRSRSSSYSREPSAGHRRPDQPSSQASYTNSPRAAAEHDRDMGYQASSSSPASSSHSVRRHDLSSSSARGNQPWATAPQIPKMMMMGGLTGNSLYSSSSSSSSSSFAESIASHRSSKVTGLRHSQSVR
ncbi:MAG: hypothetical protein M1815_000765 [Lichina confinis]|nr:MAG: hypothetical protein M1815_000765 [Lichina confinis]